MTALESVLRRRSHPVVTAEAPSHEQLLPLVAAALTVADHGDLRPYRLIELRGAARERLGAALADASGLEGAAAAAAAAKPLRASLLIAVVVCHRESFKVRDWEQDAAASGVAHVLSLLLDEAGWGVIWRTGGHTRNPAVAAVHGLAENESLLGWLYVGGRTEAGRPERPAIDAADYLSVIED